jgi:hypothetical protein
VSRQQGLVSTKDRSPNRRFIATKPISLDPSQGFYNPRMWSRWTLTWQWRGQPGPRLAVFLICCGTATPAAQSIAAPRDARPSNQTTGTGTVRGRVVAVGSDVAAPIRDARVSISTPAGSIEPVFTDASGRFEVDGLLAGRYTLTAEKTGYVKTLDGSKGDLDPPIPVDVGDAMLVDGIEIRMPKGAAILGHHCATWIGDKRSWRVSRRRSSGRPVLRERRGSVRRIADFRRAFGMGENQRLESNVLLGNLAAATPDLDAAVWLTVDSLRRLQAIAEPVTLTDREKKMTTLRCVSVP